MPTGFLIGPTGKRSLFQKRETVIKLQRNRVYLVEFPMHMAASTVTGTTAAGTAISASSLLPSHNQRFRR